MPQSGIQKTGCALLASPPNGNTVVFTDLASYPKQNGLAKALREIGRIGVGSG